MSTNGNGKDHSYGPDDEITVDEPSDAPLYRLVAHFADVSASLRSSLPRLRQLAGPTRAYLVSALGQQLIELGHAAIDAVPELERLYGEQNEPFGR